MSDTPLTDAKFGRGYANWTTTSKQLLEFAHDLERKNTRLREALKPFAAVAPHIQRLNPDTAIWAQTGTREEWNIAVTVEHIHNAAKALSP